MSGWWILLFGLSLIGFFFLLILLGAFRRWQKKRATTRQYELGIAVNAIIKQDIIGKEQAREILEECPHYDYRIIGNRLVPKGDKFFLETQRASMMVNQWLRFMPEPDSARWDEMSEEEIEQEWRACTKNYLEWREFSDKAVVSPVFDVVPREFQ